MVGGQCAGTGKPVVDDGVTHQQPRPWPDPTRRLLATPGPGDLTRRKHYTLTQAQPLAAAAVMDAMDYDAHLFTDADTGDDAIVHRTGPTGLTLTRQHHIHPLSWRAEPGTNPFTINPQPAPILTENQAMNRLCENGLPYLFYTDPDASRGHLLYRRYDADLTLITPATSDTDTTAP
ncbi:sigma 54 modulation/S30EA ribosomal C-terminal domain-containing protein [Nocardia terpenica]|uniref:sigma 54 modulation/S30EA ribosomal C-terminal domain-containing protein n=1 Tax=Nocardia terpenica TaxID=455432 RepID=UPI0012FD5C2C|nr:sigma 54 modulation/S30EA ribosomal C-terminal domain-containing protein [Nocardia terpenica]